MFPLGCHKSLLGGSGPLTWIRGYPNHGDRFSPYKDRVMGPLQNGRTLWLKNGGDPNRPLTEMILQAVPKRFCLVLLGKVLIGIM